MKNRFSEISLGIDAVEFKKARAFYEAHSRRLGPLFGPREISAIRRSRSPHQTLALIFAAKEAVFKAHASKGAGARMLSRIPIEVRGKKNASLSYKRNGSHSTLSYRKEKDFVVVKCQAS